MAKSVLVAMVTVPASTLLVYHSHLIFYGVYSRHHWDHSKCPNFRSFLISEVDFIHILCICGKTKYPDLRGEGVWSEGFHCIAVGVP